MPPHGKPDDPFAFRKAHEIRALNAHFDLRNVPPRAQDRLLGIVQRCADHRVFAIL
jgi:hypothetical protein